MYKEINVLYSVNSIFLGNTFFSPNIYFCVNFYGKYLSNVMHKKINVGTCSDSMLLIDKLIFLLIYLFSRENH